ncbi:hypothetical protein BJ138DRAFT_1118704 [Hygrophoropsis aurantiaca]|uniref:Uncharacterized protein n=1 Tax=Hygrophoropsis aurantiaca TaxID=72124 RepID=A0ACB7ZVX1_9AGAM|nr:hypothetical protein BJ138DRAFT_1118704 [Hygrophoropsis aurantiaca]
MNTEKAGKVFAGSSLLTFNIHTSNPPILSFVNMGRPRLYKTDNERAKAARGYRAKYYERDRPKIKPTLQTDNTASPPNNPKRPKHCESTVSLRNRAPSYDPLAEANMVEAALLKLTGGSSKLFVDALVTDYILDPSANYEPISQAVQKAEELEEHINQVRIARWQPFSADQSGYTQIDLAAQRVRSVILVLEDVQWNILDNADISKLYKDGFLLFQSASDIES